MAAHRPWRTTTIAVASFAIAVALALTAAACGRGSTTRAKDSAAVEDLLNRQLTLAKAADWKGLYDTYSPHYQSRCPYEEVLRRASGADAASMQSLSYDQLHVQIDGDIAYVTYVTKRNGQVIASVTDGSPDLYVKIDGIWYDEFDELAVCASTGARPSSNRQPGPGT